MQQNILLCSGLITQTFWFKLDFLLPKIESVLNILVYFLEQFQRFSWGLQPLEYTLRCSQLISSSDKKKILLTTRNVRLDSGRYATKYYYQALFLVFNMTDIGISSYWKTVLRQTWHEIAVFYKNDFEGM
jgi:hypothetical protein